MKIFTFIISLFSIMIAGLALWGVKKDLDTYNITIAVISSLTTILLCWQIYNVIDVNQKVKDIHQIARMAAKKENDKYHHTIKALITYIEATDIDKRINNTEMAVDKFMVAIKEGVKGNYSMPIDYSIDYLMKIINRGYGLQIYKGRRREYINVLSRIYNNNTSIIISHINDAIEV